MGGADDWLPLSGIQHFCFCRRQWALIHLEQQWAENRRTVEGQLDHARCHDANQTERRGGLLITRGMQVVSRRLGLSGNCDVVEFRADPEGIRCKTRKGSGSPCLSSTSMAVPRPATLTGCSSAHRPWRWKRCWCAASRRVRSSTRKRGGGRSCR